MGHRKQLVTRWAALLAIALLWGCSDRSSEGAASGATSGKGSSRSVVVFTALDRIYSEPILKRFEQKTGIRVDPVYDAESAKTTGLINRLLARRDDPECDVLWNNEVVQTESLAQQDVLEPFRSPTAEGIPQTYKDVRGRWTGFAARVRVMVYNTQKMKTAPAGDLAMFVDPAHFGRGVIALPYYGTTFTHIGVLHRRWGAARLRKWLLEAQRNQTAFAPGNGAACDLVASGERDFGLTDTDDAHSALLQGKPIGVVIPDAGDGAILIPNTVGLIRRAPHAEEGKLLIDYLLSAEVERELANGPSAQIPLRIDLQEVETPWKEMLRGAPPRALAVGEIARARKEIIRLLRDVGVGE
jgi:iron(III) transport system substrate-binding protein